MENNTKTPKDYLTESFPRLLESQIIKLVEAYFILNWVNESIDIDMFISILQKDFKNM